MHFRPGPYRRSLLLLALLAACAGLGFWLAGRGPRASGPLPHDVYVWQRSWTPAVAQAVAEHSADFAQLVPLAAEIAWKDGRPDIARTDLDFPTLRRANCRALAVRIGVYSGPFGPDAPATQAVLQLLTAVIADARAAGLALDEIQIDFDCPTSKLAGYTQWITAARGLGVPLVFTALPSWLGSGDFAALARAADGFVLQVHSLERPGRIDAPLTLCDPAAARRAVERAGRLGVPFRVALPTYGYLIAYNQRGDFIGLSAEGPAQNWPADVRLRELRADPAEMARLVAGWIADRPAAMHGIIWYRLPTDADRLNWTWPTLAAAMQGRIPAGALAAETRLVEPGLYEVELTNHGDGPAPLRAVVAVWEGGQLLAADGLAGFERGAGGKPTALRLERPATADMLQPGRRLTIAWLRFSQEAANTEVHAHVE